MPAAYLLGTSLASLCFEQTTVHVQLPDRTIVELRLTPSDSLSLIQSLVPLTFNKCSNVLALSFQKDDYLITRLFPMVGMSHNNCRVIRSSCQLSSLDHYLKNVSKGDLLAIHFPQEIQSVVRILFPYYTSQIFSAESQERIK